MSDTPNNRIRTRFRLGAPPPNRGANRGVIRPALRRPIRPVYLGQLPLERPPIASPQPLPERLAPQAEQTMPARPRAPATPSWWLSTFACCLTRPKQQREQRGERHKQQQSLLMRQITHLALLPLPATRLPVAEQRFNRGT